MTSRSVSNNVPLSKGRLGKILKGCCKNNLFTSFLWLKIKINHLAVGLSEHY